ncbi:MAG: hypothetical protein REI96_04155 [Flavobacterium nitrogenifigens]|uniref:hypothetical protein n=1 Tax=Flavobacterium nitrogenifigens TaxID=1617283 RepID=UPI002806C8CB|nr:hypothetical protein [Flavobacterium nitrogenifigens]MDQ8011617.1 hypothetical protein [Flavobacterium nitrogenifigens]
MKKIIYLLLLIQSGFLIAQTKTVVTQFGEKVTINPYVNNGLEANNGYIQLGGALTKPSVLATTPTFTLAFTGLMAGGATDNVLVTDASGVLKSVARSSFGGNDNLGNHIATMDLNMSNKNITNIYNAYIKNDLQILDRTASNTNYFGFYKNGGSFGIWNNLKTTNALTINENTNKTTLLSAQITAGTDGGAPVAGAVATAADASGNIIWKVPITKDAKTPKLVAVAKVGTSRASGTNVFFDSYVVNPENAFSGNLSTGTYYTIKNSGLHQIFINLTVQNPSGDWYLRIKKNGIVIAAIDAAKASGASAPLFAIDDFVAGDTISVDMGGNATGYQAGLTKIAVFRFE